MPRLNDKPLTSTKPSKLLPQGKKGAVRKNMFPRVSNAQKRKANKVMASFPKPAAKRHKVCSKEEAYAKSSAIAPTRLALQINFDALANFVRYLAVITSYHLQSNGSPPRFLTEDPEGWNPSMIFAYYMAILGNKLAMSGALSNSTELLVMREYVVPTFVAKWLQQMGVSKHMGRIVASYCDVPLQQFYAFDCGNGGLAAQGAVASAPCFLPTAGDSEGYYSYDNGSDPTITAATLGPEQFSRISAVISRSFRHVIAVSAIPDKAKGCELKCTPVADGIDGQLMFSCVDDKTMCDLTLPLSSFYEPTMLNSMCPVQVAAPVRVDAGLAMCQESKISFLFWLANQFPFERTDTFRKYLTKFGVEEQHMGNLQINIRQVNYQSFWAQVMSFCSTLTTMDADGYWYLCNYLASIIMSNIPGEFRAFTPVRQAWLLAPLNNTISTSPAYANFLKKPKLPNFVAQLIKALQRPIRTANQITFFVNMLPANGVNVWWTIPNTPLATFAGDATYGSKPVSPYYTSLVWNVGGGAQFIPYPGYISATSVVPNAVRNFLVIRGTAAATQYFSNYMTMRNGGQNLWNQLGVGAVNFTRRLHKYYIRSVLSDQIVTYPSTPPGGPAPTRYFQVKPVTPTLIASWEASGYHAALLAVVHLWTYFSPSDLNVATIAAVFSATPTLGTLEATSAAIAASNPGQGTTQQIQLATTKNSQDAAAHMAADSVTGVFSDQTQQVAHENIQHVKDETEKLCKDLTKGTIDEVNTLVQDGLNAL